MTSLALREKSTNKARQALADISEKHGHISPEIVVAEAKNKKHPLHGYFIWDDLAAGQKYRLDQARYLIRQIKLDIVRRDEKKREISFETTRAYVSPTSIRGGKSYLKLACAMDNDKTKAELLERAVNELKALQKRFNQIDELARVWEAIDLI